VYHPIPSPASRKRERTTTTYRLAIFQLYILVQNKSCLYSKHHLDVSSLCLCCTWTCLGYPRNKQITILGSNRNKPKQDMFRFCFVFLKPKTKIFLFFRFFSMFRTFIETTGTNRTFSKQTETTLNFLKNAKICSLSNCFGWASVVSVQSKHQNSLSLYRSETCTRNKLFQNKPKQP
jgi:hypothetical protein